MKFLKQWYYRFLKIKNRIFFGPPILVLMYHRINDHIDKNVSQHTVTVSVFEKQIAYIKENFEILKITSDWSSIKKPAIVLTFDDGYADNFLNALPILEKFSLPATFFLTTLNVNTNEEFWWDRISLDYTLIDDFFFINDIEEKVSKRYYSLNILKNKISKFNNEEIKNWLLLFEKRNSITYKERESFRSLSTWELDEINKNPLIDIGIHTHNHYPLSNLTKFEQKAELEFSISKFKERGLNFINYLALPNGAYNSETRAVVDDLGLEGMFLANNYYSNLNNKKKGKISRILMPNIDNQALLNYLKYYV